MGTFSLLYINFLYTFTKKLSKIVSPLIELKFLELLYFITFLPVDVFYSEIFSRLVLKAIKSFRSTVFTVQFKFLSKSQFLGILNSNFLESQIFISFYLKLFKQSGLESKNQFLRIFSSNFFRRVNFWIEYLSKVSFHLTFLSKSQFLRIF